MSEMLQRIEQRMASGEPFTYGQLSAMSNGDAMRIADRAIQKWRRRGWIAFERKNRGVWWSLTDKGREALNQSGQPANPT